MGKAAAAAAPSGSKAPPDGDRVAVITGGGSGIGRAAAVRFAAAGYQVFVLGRRREALIETQAQVATKARVDRERCSPVVVDVTSEEAVRLAFDQVAAARPRLDVLVNCAGVFGPHAEPDELSLAQWAEVMDTNLTGTFLCCRAAFALMRRQDPPGGRIVNIGSVSAHAPRPGSIAYTASKHAITGITKSIALDGRPYRIACSQLDIGNAATEMTSGFQRGVVQPNGQLLAEPVFDVADAADMLVRVAELPLEANVLSMTLMATGMPFVGRG